MKVVLWVMFFVISMGASAQFQWNVKATGKHERALGRAKSLRSQGEQVKSKSQKVKNTAQQINELSETDSLRLTTVVDTAAVFPDSLKLSGRDEWPLDTASIRDTASEEVFNNKLDEYLKEQGMLNEVPGSSGGISAEDLLTDQLTIPEMNLNPGALTVDKISALLDNVGLDKLYAGHEQLAKYKETYREVQSLADTSSAVKISSLKNVPIRERIFYKGSLSVISTDPFLFDLDGGMGLSINRRWDVGVSLLWRDQISRKRDSLAYTPSHMHGLGISLSRDIARRFLAYSEIQSLQSTSLWKVQNEGPPAVWQYRVLIGIGSKMVISDKLVFTTLLLYDLNHRNNNLYPLPFQLKFGYSFGSTF